MNNEPSSLANYSAAIVAEPDPARKVVLARETGRAWQAGAISATSNNTIPDIPDQPGRPAKPELLSIKDMPRRRIGTRKGLIALVHSLAHIELNAIDMAFDFIARFANTELPADFLEGAVKVAVEEARHFEMINSRLEDLGASYGDLPAHDGLWQACRATRHDLLARLAIVPLVLEARGLDVSPKMIDQVKSIGDTTTAAIMVTIYRDEITHVAFGTKWFHVLCEQQGFGPQLKFQALVREYFRGPLKPPFNEEARLLAGLSREYYQPLASD